MLGIIPAAMAALTHRQPPVLGPRYKSALLASTRASAGTDLIDGVLDTYGTNVDRAGNTRTARNAIRNPRVEYASAPSLPTTTRPTYWGGYTTNGGAYSITGQGVENGFAYIEVTYSGISAGTGVMVDFYPEATAIAATTGQVWTLSCYARLMSAMPAGANLSMALDEQTSGGAYVVGSGQAAAVASTMQRFAVTRTLSGSTTAQILPILRISATGVVNLAGLVLRFYAPQLELGSTATLPVTLPPVSTPAASTSTVEVAPQGMLIEAASTNTVTVNDGTGAVPFTGTPAKLQAVVSGGAVTAVNVIDGGSGYTQAPTIVFIRVTADNTASGATATATISGGAVTAVTVNTGGSNFNSAPMVVARSNTGPTGWSMGGFTVVGVGTEAGIAYIDVRLRASAPGANTYTDMTMPCNASVAVPQTWTGSMYGRLLAGSWANVTGPTFLLYGSPSFSDNVSAALAGLTNASLASQRVVATKSFTGTTTGISPRFALTLTGAGDVDFTLRIGLPQVEANYYASSPIVCSGTAATRAADAVNLTGANFNALLMPPARTNLALWSQDPTNAAWGKNVGTIAGNTAGTTAPDGSSTAAKWQETTTSGEHQLRQAVSGIADFTNVTWSIYLKAAERTKARVGIYSKTGAAIYIDLDLTAGTITAQGGPVVSANIVSAGSGWFRVSLVSSTNTGGVTPTAFVSLLDGAGTLVYAGDASGTFGCYVWGAQLEVAPVALPPNLIANPERFLTSSYTLGALTATTGVALAPDGSLADKLAEDATTAQHMVQWNTIGATIGSKWTIAVYAKAAERSVIGLTFNGETAQPSFDLIAGTVTAGATVSSITSVGNGWWRCVSTFTRTTVSSLGYIGLVSFGSRAGTAGAGVYLWGVQVFQGDAAPPYQPLSGLVTAYIPTTSAAASVTGTPRTNLALRSEAIDNGTWNKVNATINADATTAPDGSTTADKIVEAATTGAHYIYQGASAVIGQTLTLSAYLKAGERTKVQFGVGNPAVGNVDRTITVDLSAGTISAVDAIFTAASCVSVGSGWFRVSGTFTATATGVLTILPVARMMDGSGNISYLGDGSGLYCWGVQLEVTPVALGAPNLIQPGAEYFGSSSWTPFGGLTKTENTDTAPDGTLSADTLAFANGGVFYATTAANATTYTFSVWLRAASAVSVNVVLNTNLSDPVTVVANVTTTWQRFSVTKTTAASGVTGLSSQISTSGTVSVFAWGAQTVQAATPADYVPLSRMVSAYIGPTTSAALSKTGAEQGFCILDVMMPQVAPPTANQFIAQVDDTSAENRLYLFTAGGSGGVLYLRPKAGRNAFGFGDALAPTIFTAGTVFRVGIRWGLAANGLGYAYSVCKDGGAIASVMGPMALGMNNLCIGHALGSSHLNGRILNVQAGRRLLSDAEFIARCTLGR